MKRLPTLFVSHGSPMHALDSGAAGMAWKAFADAIARPKAILIASAHWETGVPMLTGADKLETIHDFSGFPEPLYKLTYPAPGAPELARRVRDLLKQQGQCAGLDGTRGLDHGAWTPLLHMYPDADIPVVQLSIQPERGPAPHLALGAMLAPLRDEGVLVIGSGHMTHNLREGFAAMRKGGHHKPLAYAVEFSQWVGERITRQAFSDLIDYRRLAPHATQAHPTEEHFLPLFIALGAAGEHCQPRLLYRAIEWGSLAMDAWAFD
jgi:4,5-DOPA dioxygenase extradiol